MCMFWKRFMKCETAPAEDADDVESDEYQLAQATIKSLNEQLEYQTDLAQSYCRRVHELEQQLTHKTDLADAHRSGHLRVRERVEELEKQVAELTRGLEYFKKQYRNASESLAEIAGRIIAYQNCSGNLPAVDESPIGDSVGEETQVFDSAAVKLPDGFVDSAGYGEA